MHVLPELVSEARGSLLQGIVGVRKISVGPMVKENFTYLWCKDKRLSLKSKGSEQDNVLHTLNNIKNKN